MPHTLLIPLVGPMQAWGSRSRFDDRDTHPFPTKSGVIGLVCAALGRQRGASLADLNTLRFGARGDSPGQMLTDYHTAQEDARTSGTGGQAIPSKRHYLTDAAFLIGLEGENLAFLQTLEAALKNPVWALALGRKSFPLSVPPYLPGGSIRENLILEEALKTEPWRPVRLPVSLKMPEKLPTWTENEEGEATLLDAPLSFENRRFALRRLHVDLTDVPAEKLPWNFISPS